MGKPHEQGRYAALRLAVAGLRTVQLSILLSGILLAWGTGAYGLDPALDVSQYAHTAWRVRDGFTKGAIYSMAQTPDGYLWLGTEFGLVRFDGVQAVPWQPPNNQYAPHGAVYSLLVARDGTLWIGTKGLASWKDGKLTQYPELADRFIFKLLEDQEGTVWAGGVGIPTGRLCAIHKSRIDCYGDDGGFGRGVFGLYEDIKGNLWAGVQEGLWRWKPGPPKFYSLPGEPNGIQALGEDTDGAFLVGWKHGIYRFIEGKTERYSLPGIPHQFEAKKIIRDRNAGLWIATWNHGLIHVHQGRTDVFTAIEGLSGDDVHALLEDREGTIWISTLGGLDRFRDFAVATLTVKQGLSGALVGSVLADRNGGVWFSTFHGLNQWDHGEIRIPGTGSAKRDGMLNGFVPESFFQDQRGRILVSTSRELGYLENGRFTSIKSVPGGNMLSIAQDTADNLWVINENAGLFRISPQNGVLQIPWANLGHKDHASVLAADRRRGGLWIGFFLGGIVYLSDGQIRASYTAADGLGAGRVSDFRFDDDGTLWVSSEGGLSRLKNNRLATLTSKNGLPCDAVHWAMEEDDRSLWLYTACGLVRIARSDIDDWATAVDKSQDTTLPVRATVFDSSDGVRSLPYPSHWHPQVAKTPDGKLWFLPWDGVSVIDPHHIPFNRVPPPVHIEQVIADRKTYWQNLSGDASSSHPRLPPLVRDLTVDYTALSLVVPQKVRFRYKLEGWDRDWQDAGTRRQAFYTNLSPHKYRFRVMACNNSGVWNETGAFLDFSIAPAYWQTSWFRAACVAAFKVLLWMLYRMRLRQLAREFNAGLEARVNERTRIARELHDSLLQGFQGLMFRLQAVRDMLPGRAPAEAIKALDIALERGDKAIAEGRDTVSDLRQPVMGDSDIAQALTALGEELAAQSDNGAAPCVRVLVEGKQRELNPILRDEIYRIAREALRNAFRHARAQKIEAEITYSDSEFLLHVRDNGGGIDPAFANQGSRAGHWGLPGMRERAKSFGGKLEVWSEHGAGTEIELSVPGAIAYGKSEPRRRFWLWRKKIGESDGQQS